MDEALADLAIELGKLAVVVVLVESAMSTLFNWRVYRAVFNHRALKTPIMLAVGLMIVWGFGYDIFARAMVLVGAIPANANGNLLTQVVSAMIIAGGSSGINTLFQNLVARLEWNEPAMPLQELRCHSSLRAFGRESSVSVLPLAGC